MNFQVVRNSENAIIGFNIDSTCCTEEDFFVRNLPINLGRGLADIKVVDNKLIIDNDREGTWSREVSSPEINIIKDYLENDDTKFSIKISNFGLRAAIRFENEQVRRKSITISNEDNDVANSCV